ncbi:MAG: hypothetical protein AB7W59_14540 [Acidimicrobiia bacterium]
MDPWGKMQTSQRPHRRPIVGPAGDRRPGAADHAAAAAEATRRLIDAARPPLVLDAPELYRSIGELRELIDHLAGSLRLLGMATIDAVADGRVGTDNGADPAATAATVAVALSTAAAQLDPVTIQLHAAGAALGCLYDWHPR